jgi:spermidine synthase
MGGPGGPGRARARFEELAWRRTPLGELSLRRRWDPVAGREVHEIKLADEYLMSSLFTTGEVELARLALPRPAGAHLEVAVGGLGLGYTALAALDHPDVASLVVVEALGEVIDWHRRGLVPAGAVLATDPRCRLLPGDFFAMLRSPAGLDPDTPGRRFHAILVDIDHSPRHLLHPDHGWFYQPAGLRRLTAHLHPGGVLGLWSNDPPDDQFVATLREVFGRAGAETVHFPNPYQPDQAANTIYLAHPRPDP